MIGRTNGAVFLSVAALLSDARVCRGDHVDDVVQAEMAKRHIPGVELAVIEDRRIIREQSYGLSDVGRKTPVDSSTLFQVASVSKPVTAVGALRLVERGKISFDENINNKLRSWKVPENEFTRGHPVTLRLLLAHGAGVTLPGFGEGYAIGAPLPTLLQQLEGLPPSHYAAVRVTSVPGEEKRYSGGGYLIIQQLIVDVTGQSFEKYMEKEVLRPLGMTSSTFGQILPANLKARAASGYSGTNETPVVGRWRLHPALAAGGLWSTAGDIARFLIGIQKAYSGAESSILSQKLTREMLTKQIGDSGLGFFLGGTPLRFGHNGDNKGFNAVSVAFPESGQGVVFLMNAQTDIEAVANVLVEAVGDEYHWPSYPLSH